MIDPRLAGRITEEQFIIGSQKADHVLVIDLEHPDLKEPHRKHSASKIIADLQSKGEMWVYFDAEPKTYGNANLFKVVDSL